MFTTGNDSAHRQQVEYNNLISFIYIQHFVRSKKIHCDLNSLRMFLSFTV